MRRRLMNKIVFTFVLLLASITAKADERIYSLRSNEEDFNGFSQKIIKFITRDKT